MIEAVVNNGTSGVALAFVTTPTAPTVFTPPAVIRAVPGIAVPLTIILGVNVISSLAQQTAVLEALAGLSALLDHATDDDPCQECIEKRVWGQDSNRQMVDLPPTRLRRP